MDSGPVTRVNDSAVMGVGIVHAFLDFYILLIHFFPLCFSFLGFTVLRGFFCFRFLNGVFFLVIVLISCHGVSYKGCIILSYPKIC